MLSNVQSLVLHALIRVNHLVVGWQAMCLLVSVLLYYIDLTLASLCAYLCDIVGGGMCHFEGMCIRYMLGTCFA